MHMVKKLVNTKLEKLDPKIEKVFKEREVGALLKNINGNIDRLIDGHLNLDKKIDKLGQDLGGKIDSLDDRMCSVEKRIGALEVKVDSLEVEMHDSFKAVITHLISIEDQIAEIKARLETKADKKDLVIIEQRVTKLELELVECKKMISAVKNS